MGEFFYFFEVFVHYKSFKVICHKKFIYLELNLLSNNNPPDLFHNCNSVLCSKKVFDIVCI